MIASVFDTRKYNKTNKKSNRFTKKVEIVYELFGVIKKVWTFQDGTIGWQESKPCQSFIAQSAFSWSDTSYKTQ